MLKMLRKIASLFQLDATNADVFRKQWDLTDKTFKSIQWLVTIAAVAAMAKKTHDYVLLVVAFILVIMFFLALIRLLGAIMQTRFPEIHNRRWATKVLVIIAVSIIPVAIIQTTFHVLDTIIAAQSFRGDGG